MRRFLPENGDWESLELWSSKLLSIGIDSLEQVGCHFRFEVDFSGSAVLTNPRVVDRRAPHSFLGPLGLLFGEVNEEGLEHRTCLDVVFFGHCPEIGRLAQKVRQVQFGSLVQVFLEQRTHFLAEAEQSNIFYAKHMKAFFLFLVDQKKHFGSVDLQKFFVRKLTAKFGGLEVLRQKVEGVEGVVPLW